MMRSLQFNSPDHLLRTIDRDFSQGQLDLLFVSDHLSCIFLDAHLSTGYFQLYAVQNLFSAKVNFISDSHSTFSTLFIPFLESKYLMFRMIK